MGMLAKLLVAFGILWLGSFGAYAAATTPAEQFVQQSADQAIAILGNKSLTEDQRQAQLLAFLSSLLDLKRVALFTLGPAAKTAPPDALAAYVDAYQRFALANYQSELRDYHGQTLVVTGSTPRAGETIVNANVVDPLAKAGRPPVAQVAFRVVNTGGKFAIVDASIMGIWFTLAQRDEFAGFLAQHGGDVSALTQRLNAMTAQLQSGAAAAGK
jgi:phospholipid transport system substrate-binding protein